MRVNRSKFIQHLTRLMCAGQFNEVVFRDGFAVTALTQDQLVLLDAPGLEGAEPLDEEIGIADLALLAKALRLHPGEGNTGVEVDVYLEDRRLVIDDSERGGPIQELIATAPKVVRTRVEDSTAEKLFNAAKDGQEVALTKNILEGVCSAYSLYKAEEIEIQVTTKGATIFVGSSKSNRAKFNLLGVKSKEEYSLKFSKHLVDVFSTVSDFSSAALILNGDKLPVLIVDGEYNYILSPRAPSADEGKGTKPEMKKRKKSDDAPAPDETPKARARARTRARTGAPATGPGGGYPVETEE